MKFILSILAVLAIVFLVGCSAKDTRDNKLSNSEITKLGKKYGGVYVFNKKFEKEIDDRERERKEAIKELKGRDLGDGLYAVDTKLVDEKFPQTLSNGKKYYTSTRAYGEDYNKQAKLPEIYKEKIINFIGQEDYNKFKPSMLLSYFYVDDNK
ncbi:tRNA 2-selenouridine synthase, partial [Campylobacter rectus]